MSPRFIQILELLYRSLNLSSPLRLVTRDRLPDSAANVPASRPSIHCCLTDLDANSPAFPLLIDLLTNSDANALVFRVLIRLTDSDANAPAFPLLIPASIAKIASLPPSLSNRQIRDRAKTRILIVFATPAWNQTKDASG